jgi:hypothetical protein
MPKLRGYIGATSIVYVNGKQMESVAVYHVSLPACGMIGGLSTDVAESSRS